MKILTTLRISRFIQRYGYILAIVSFLSITRFVTASFQPDDEVRLTHDTPLLFLNKPFRQGSTGENFKVLAVKPEQKLVFLSAKDNAGKDIAVSVPEDALEFIPPDLVKVRADVLAAVDHQQFAQAKRAVTQALRSKPEDPDLRSLGIAVDMVAKSAVELSVAQSKQAAVEVDLKRRRHNADVTDRTNPLDPNDNSGRQRAQQMRAEADRFEKEAAQSLAGVRANYDAAVSALTSVASQNRHVADSSLNIQPGLPVSAAQAKHQQEDDARFTRDAERARQQELEAMKEWTEDEAVVPAGAKTGEPTFEATIDFINGKIASGRQKLWFGKRHQKLIYQNHENFSTVDPALLNAEVKTFETRDQFHQHFLVQLETIGGKNDVEIHGRMGMGSKISSRLSLECNDEIDAKKVATACRHLVLLCGGSDDLF